MIYFAYSISHGNFHTCLLSSLCQTTQEALVELARIHNSSEVEFYLGDSEKVGVGYKTFDEMVDHIMSIYDKYLEIELKLIVSRYIITRESERYVT